LNAGLWDQVRALFFGRSRPPTQAGYRSVPPWNGCSATSVNLAGIRGALSSPGHLFLLVLMVVSRQVTIWGQSAGAGSTMYHVSLFFLLELELENLTLNYCSSSLRMVKTNMSSIVSWATVRPHSSCLPTQIRFSRICLCSLLDSRAYHSHRSYFRDIYISPQQWMRFCHRHNVLPARCPY
jgi:hypothetical protein